MGGCLSLCCEDTGHHGRHGVTTHANFGHGHHAPLIGGHHGGHHFGGHHGGGHGGGHFGGHHGGGHGGHGW